MNPSYLKAVLGESDFQANSESPVASETVSESVRSAVGEDATKSAIAEIQARIRRIREEIAQLNAGKGAAAPVDAASLKTTLNELRLKRLAVQMALVAGEEGQSDEELRFLDGCIAEISLKIARATQSGAEEESGDGELEARISALRAERQLLGHDLKRLVAGRYLALTVCKAEEYLNVLRSAHALRHELLVLASMAPQVGPLKDLDLGGELPVPGGVETFEQIRPEELATGHTHFKAAKSRIRRELGLS